jgi:membrane protein Man1
VFAALHGQWFNGHLITVKYMRDDRYYGRFPDSRNQTTPLRPAAKLRNI